MNDKNKLHSVVKTCSKITGVKQRDLHSPWEEQINSCAMEYGTTTTLPPGQVSGFFRKLSLNYSFPEIVWLITVQHETLSSTGSCVCHGSSCWSMINIILSYHSEAALSLYFRKATWLSHKVQVSPKPCNIS